MLMETLSYFPLAKLETITDLTFINFSTTICRNVRKQLHENWLIVLITATSPGYIYIFFSSLKIRFGIFLFWLVLMVVHLSLKNPDLFLTLPMAQHFQIWRRPHISWHSLHEGKDCFLPITQLYPFKQTLMNWSLRATLHLLVNDRS